MGMVLFGIAIVGGIGVAAYYGLGFVLAVLDEAARRDAAIEVAPPLPDGCDLFGDGA